MLPILQFIFSSLWVWLGAMFMLTVVMQPIHAALTQSVSVLDAIKLAILNAARGK